MASNYGSTVGFLTYCTSRGITPPITDENEIVVSLLVASEWLDATYRTYFNGKKVDGREQEREWPRTGATDIYKYPINAGAVPREVEYATYEAALVNLNAPGSLSKDYTPNKYKSASVSGAVSVEYNSFDNWRESQTTFVKVNEWLSSLLSAGLDSSGLVGQSFRV